MCSSQTKRWETARRRIMNIAICLCSYWSVRSLPRFICVIIPAARASPGVFIMQFVMNIPTTGSLRMAHYIDPFFSFPLFLVMYRCSSPRPHHTRAHGSDPRNLHFMSTFVLPFFLVPVFEEHQDIPQGVPRQVWPPQQRTVRPL